MILDEIVDIANFFTIVMYPTLLFKVPLLICRSNLYNCPVCISPVNRTHIFIVKPNI